MKTIKLETIDRVSERKPGECYAVGKSSDGIEGETALTDIRGSISPPSADVPGYWLFLGTKYKPNNKGKPVRLFLKEGESRNHRRLVGDLIEAAGKYRSRELYCPENSGIFSSLVKKFWSINGVFVQPAPHENDEDFGISLIIEALEDETLEIPRGTILHSQLEQTTADNLGYTLHALRYLLAGFSLYQPRRTGNMSVRRINYFYG